MIFRGAGWALRTDNSLEQSLGELWVAVLWSGFALRCIGLPCDETFGGGDHFLCSNIFLSPCLPFLDISYKRNQIQMVPDLVMVPLRILQLPHGVKVHPYNHAAVYFQYTELVNTSL